MKNLPRIEEFAPVLLAVLMVPAAIFGLYLLRGLPQRSAQTQEEAPLAAQPAPGD